MIDSDDFECNRVIKELKLNILLNDQKINVKNC